MGYLASTQSYHSYDFDFISGTIYDIKAWLQTALWLRSTDLPVLHAYDIACHGPWSEDLKQRCLASGEVFTPVYEVRRPLGFP